MSDAETEVDPRWKSLGLPLECPNCGYDGDEITALVTDETDDEVALEAEMSCWDCDHEWVYER